MVSVFDGISVNMGTGTPNVDDAPRSVGMTIHIPLGARSDEFAQDQQRSSPGVLLSEGVTWSSQPMKLSTVPAAIAP